MLTKEFFKRIQERAANPENRPPFSIESLLQGNQIRPFWRSVPVIMNSFLNILSKHFMDTFLNTFRGLKTFDSKHSTGDFDDSNDLSQIEVFKVLRQNQDTRHFSFLAVKLMNFGVLKLIIAHKASPFIESFQLSFHWARANGLDRGKTFSKVRKLRIQILNVMHFLL